MSMPSLKSLFAEVFPGQPDPARQVPQMPQTGYGKGFVVTIIDQSGQPQYYQFADNEFAQAKQFLDQARNIGYQATIT